MKTSEKQRALEMRYEGYSINTIARAVGVAKSTVSVWVRGIELDANLQEQLKGRPYSSLAIERRRSSRLMSEAAKRQIIIDSAQSEIDSISLRELWLIGVMLYWAEGGKTQRMFRFSNGDPEMIRIMMKFLRLVCDVDETKLRGYIHIHPHLSVEAAETYWSLASGIPKSQFFKTYRKSNKSSKNTGKNTLPHGVLDIYVLDTKLFLKVTGWASAIFSAEINKSKDS